MHQHKNSIKMVGQKQVLNFHQKVFSDKKTVTFQYHHQHVKIHTASIYINNHRCIAHQKSGQK